MEKKKGQNGFVGWSPLRGDARGIGRRGLNSSQSCRNLCGA